MNISELSNKIYGLNNLKQGEYINFKQDLEIVAIVIIGLNLAEKLLNYFRNRVTTKFKLKININLKSELYKHVLNLEYDSYNSYDKTEMMQRINEDADVYSDFFNSQSEKIC